MRPQIKWRKLPHGRLEFLVRDFRVTQPLFARFDSRHKNGKHRRNYLPMAPPYVNYLVGLPGSEKDARIVKLIAALQTPATKKFIEEKYSGAVIPAF